MSADSHRARCSPPPLLLLPPPPLLPTRSAVAARYAQPPCADSAAALAPRLLPAPPEDASGLLRRGSAAESCQRGAGPSALAGRGALAGALVTNRERDPGVRWAVSEPRVSWHRRRMISSAPLCARSRSASSAPACTMRCCGTSPSAARLPRDSTAAPCACFHSDQSRSTRGTASSARSSGALGRLRATEVRLTTRQRVVASSRGNGPEPSPAPPPFPRPLPPPSPPLPLPSPRAAVSLEAAPTLHCAARSAPSSSLPIDSTRPGRSTTSEGSPSAGGRHALAIARTAGSAAPPPRAVRASSACSGDGNRNLWPPLVCADAAAGCRGMPALRPGGEPPPRAAAWRNPSGELLWRTAGAPPRPRGDRVGEPVGVRLRRPVGLVVAIRS
mmetsp:Transcript_67616/g.178308  ORF Transcript_67616/g.178308 Transcript_67616/m.178308 type:complete len:387 (-) Transcript_67616:542-1702(-)